MTAVRALAGSAWSSAHAGTNQKIIGVLELYNRLVPITFLAGELGRSKQQILSDLDSLRARGIVRIEDDRVALRS